MSNFKKLFNKMIKQYMISSLKLLHEKSKFYYIEIFNNFRFNHKLNSNILKKIFKIYKNLIKSMNNLLKLKTKVYLFYKYKYIID